MNKQKYLRLFCCIGLLLLWISSFSTAAASEEEYFVPDSENISYMLDNPNFSLYRQYAVNDTSLLLNETFPGGIIGFVGRAGEGGTPELFGLMDSTGEILLQPQYMWPSAAVCSMNGSILSTPG